MELCNDLDIKLIDEDEIINVIPNVEYNILLIGDQGNFIIF